MDILGQLRKPLEYRDVDGVSVACHPSGPIDDLIEEAADEIERLRREIAKLKARSTKRSYTPREMDTMRGFVRDMLIVPNQPYYPQEMDARIEGQLRTYMESGISPEELCDARCKAIADQQEAELQSQRYWAEVHKRKNRPDDA